MAPRYASITEWSHKKIIKVHRFLGVCRYQWGDNDFEFKLTLHEEDRLETALKKGESAVWHEYVTHPALNTISLFDKYTINSKSGVTIGQVIKAYICYYHKIIPGTTPPDLPNEIWLMILPSIAPWRETQLLYYLKNCSEVSKRFRGLVAQIIQDMDRRVPENQRILSESYIIALYRLRVHPSFGTIDWNPGSAFDTIRYLRRQESWKRSFPSLKDESFALKPATHPSVTLLGLRFECHIIVNVGETEPKPFHMKWLRNEDGVTIMQVVQAVCDYAETSLPEEAQNLPYLTREVSARLPPRQFADLLGPGKGRAMYFYLTVDTEGRLIFTLPVM